MAEIDSKTTFWHSKQFLFVWFWQIFAWTYYLTLKTSMCRNFSFIAKFKMAARGQRSKIDQIWPTNHILARHLVPVHQIWTKFCMNILLDPLNKPAQQFLIYRKIQDGRWGSKVQNLPNLTSQITFRLGIWIWFIRFGQNLAWTYFLTLQTSLRKNFSFIAKSKMAAGGQRSKIDQNWLHKSHSGLAFEARSSDLDKVWHGHTTWPYKQTWLINSCTNLFVGSRSMFMSIFVQIW